jgi:hypothetical protein
LGPEQRFGILHALPRTLAPAVVPRSRQLLVALTLALTLTGCKIFAGRPAREEPNELVVMGTLHAGHLESERYGLERLEELLREVNPRLILCEAMPEQYEAAWQRYVETGEVDEELARSAPEVTEVLFPLALEGRVRVVPCSAWTTDLLARRAELISQWRSSRPADTRAVEGARRAAEERLEELGMADDPLQIHTARYDSLVERAMEPYERLFSRDLGEAGWERIHRSHAKLLEEALDPWKGDGIRVVVLFGAWSKYRLRELLAGRSDVAPLELAEALRPRHHALHP